MIAQSAIQANVAIGLLPPLTGVADYTGKPRLEKQMPLQGASFSAFVV